MKFAVTAAESLNPFAYAHLKHRHFIENISYITSLVFICLIAMSLLYLPMISQTESRVAEGLGIFKSRGISYELKDEKPLEASFYGIRAINVGKSNGNALLSIDNEGITSRHALCESLSIFCGLFPDSRVSAEDAKELSGSKKELAGAARTLLILSLPGIFIAALIFYTAKYLSIAAAFTVITFFATKAIKFRINLNSIFAIGTYSSIVLVVPDMLGSSLGMELFSIPWIAFAAMFATGILLNAEKIEGEKHGHRGDTKDKHTGKGAA